MPALAQWWSQGQRISASWYRPVHHLGLCALPMLVVPRIRIEVIERDVENLLNSFEISEFRWNDCHLYRNLLLRTKCHQNRTLFIEMWRVNDFKITAVCHLALPDLQFVSHDLYRHAIMLQSATICWNRTIACCCWVMSKNDFEDGNRPPSWILKILIFGHVTVIRFNICCCNKPNVIKIRYFFTEICWLNDLICFGEVRGKLTT